ncbi:MAG: hypothetical protein JWQ88_1020, partial [Rhodoferax sp.]|nr:hypothetical protein [Rhodoferax sp.]
MSLDEIPVSGTARLLPFEPGPRRVYAKVACLLAAAMGAMVLAGWALDLPLLRSLLPGAVEMKANTAMGLLGSAASLWLLVVARAPVISRGLAVGVAILGAVTLFEYALGRNFGLDEWLFADNAAAFNQARGRMSPFSALSFVALGGALWCLSRPGMARVTRAAAGVVAAVGIVSIVGYLWNVYELVTDRVAPPVALHTACAFALLGSAVYLLGNRARNQRGRDRSRLETLVLGGFIPMALFVVMGG